MDVEDWERVLVRYGQGVTLDRGSEKAAVKAFFQPVEEKTPGEVPTPLGVAKRGKYLYLGPAGEPLEDVEELLWQGRAFRPLRHRTVWLGEKVFYRWGLFEECDG